MKSVSGVDTIRREKSPMNDLSRTFDEVVSIIETARSNAFRKVNEELILMYMNVGRFLSENSKDAGYGDEYVSALAD